LINRNVNEAVSRALLWSDLVLFLLLIALGTWVVVSKPWALDAASAAALSGAMYGGGALLLGNWINRVIEGQRTAADNFQRIEKLRELIAGELVNIAVGLVQAKRLIDAAIISLRAGGPVPQTFDMTSYRPRALNLIEGLGSELLTLDKAAIDALATLRANLAITQKAIDEIGIGANFGILRATELSKGLAHDISVLSKAIQHIAPNRKLQFPGGAPELLTIILARESNSQDMSRY